MTQIDYCIAILHVHLIDLERLGWQIVLAEHPERERIIEYEQKLNIERREAILKGIKILESSL